MHLNKQSCQQHWIYFCVEQDSAKVLLLLYSFSVHGIFVIHWYLIFFSNYQRSERSLESIREDFVTAVTTSQSLCVYLYSFTTSSRFLMQLYSHSSRWCNCIFLTNLWSWRASWFIQIQRNAPLACVGAEGGNLCRANSVSWRMTLKKEMSSGHRNDLLCQAQTEARMPSAFL